MKHYISFNNHKKKLLSNPAVAAEYDALAAEYAVVRAVIEKRRQKNMTQAQLAQKMGTGQSAISRLEMGVTNPSVKFLQRVAKAFDSTLTIAFE